MSQTITARDEHYVEIEVTDPVSGEVATYTGASHAAAEDAADAAMHGAGLDPATGQAL